ncbi:hypothetical protein [uncultured Mediterranean phage uvMED]|nr:hypothetical protein [uncultured Mediterranean phage uvMED]
MAIIKEKRQVSYETRIGVNRGTSKPAEAQAVVADSYGSLFADASKFAYNRAIENGKMEALERAESQSFTTQDIDLGNGNITKMPVKYTERTDLGRTGNKEYARLMNAKYNKSLNNSLDNLILDERNSAQMLEISKGEFDKKIRSKLSLVFESLDPDDRANAKLHAESKIVESGFYVDKTHKSSQVQQDKLLFNQQSSNILLNSATEYYAYKDRQTLNLRIKELQDEKDLYRGRMSNNDLNNMYDNKINRLNAKADIYDLLDINISDMMDLSNLNNTNNKTMKDIAQFFSSNGVNDLKINNKVITKEQVLSKIKGDKTKIFQELALEYQAFQKEYATKYQASLSFIKVNNAIIKDQASDLTNDKIKTVLNSPEFLEQIYETYAMQTDKTESYKQAQQSGAIMDFYGYLYKNKNVHALPPAVINTIVGAAKSRNVDVLSGYAPLIRFMGENSQYMKENGFDSEQSDLISDLAEVPNATPDNYRLVMDKFDSVRNDKELTEMYSLGLTNVFNKTQGIKGEFKGVSDFNNYLSKQVNDLRGIGDIRDDSENERFGHLVAYKIKKAVMDRIEASNRFPTKNKVQQYIFEEGQNLIKEQNIGKSVIGFSPLALGGSYITDTETLMTTTTLMENPPDRIHSEAFTDGGFAVTKFMNTKINSMIKTKKQFGSDAVTESLSEPKGYNPALSRYKLYPLENKDGTFDYQVIHIGKNVFEPTLLRDEVGDPLIITVEEFGKIAESLQNNGN